MFPSAISHKPIVLAIFAQVLSKISGCPTSSKNTSSCSPLNSGDCHSGNVLEPLYNFSALIIVKGYLTLIIELLKPLKLKPW